MGFRLSTAVMVGKSESTERCTHLLRITNTISPILLFLKLLTYSVKSRCLLV